MEFSSRRFATNDMLDDASATYRGFRNQALYVLYRLLTDEQRHSQIYRPEGAEDLAIFDSDQRLKEVVQVKDYSSDLTVTHLKIKKAYGFFARFNNRLIEHPDCKTVLASFGPLGPELHGALNGVQPHRATVIEKMANSDSSVSKSNATTVLEKLKDNVIHPKAPDLAAAVKQALQGTNIGGDLDSSIELLHYWIFRAAEGRQDLTFRGLLAQLQRIGEFLVALRDSSSEWGVSLTEVKRADIGEEAALRLVAEYRQGVQARWEHILADADHVRTERLSEIHQKLQSRPVVIIRGASGQGKSTIGWRYLHDYCVDGLRFHVRLVDGREHAMRIANALGSHIQRLNLQAVAYLDVSPSDTGWVELVRELAATGLKVVVAVREEDFQRANVAAGDISYSELTLDRITKEEAEPIYQSLCQGVSNSAIDFEEAWAKFDTQEGGPLLEFTYLITEGESLGSRIGAQIRRLQSEATSNRSGLTPSHLRLLALAAVANEAGARVYLKPLCDEVGLDPLTRPLKDLEKEFLVRTKQEDVSLTVAGLHSLRSKAIVDALFTEAPELWEKYATKVLPMIADDDLEGFLLFAFSRHHECAGSLHEQILKVSPRSWTHAGGIVRSLLWDGVSRYERTNRATIGSLISKHDVSWWFFCDSSVGTGPEALSDLLQGMSKMAGKEIQPIELTPKTEIFELFERWAKNVVPPPAPQSSRDWVGAGDIAHWLAAGKVDCALAAAIRDLLPEPLPTVAPIGDIGRFISGRAIFEDEAFLAWSEKMHNEILERFMVESNSAHVVDDGQEIKVFYLVSPTKDAGSDTDEWNSQSMRRVHLLHQLIPNREIFSAQGIGLETFVELTGHDPTKKNIPVGSLFSERGTWMNALFLALVAYRHNRPNSWREYASKALEYREAVCECFRKLHRGWAKMLAQSPPKKAVIAGLPGAELGLIEKLSKLPKFPKSAVDEWGHLSEDRAKSSSTDATMQELSLRRFDDWKVAFRDFESSVGMVTSKIFDLTILYVVEETKGYVANATDAKNGHLLLINLATAWLKLNSMQEAFRRHYGLLFSAGRLRLLEVHELINFRHLWFIAYAVCNDRRRHEKGLSKVVEAEFDAFRERFTRDLRFEIDTTLNGTGKSAITWKPWLIGGTPHLCVVCDHDRLESALSTPPIVVEAAWRAAQNQNWKWLEWTPLEVEWPKIAFVHLVGGKALTTVSARVSTKVLFSNSDSFEIQLHHYAAMPVETAEFAEMGFKTWSSPLLRAAISLQGTVAAFVVDCARFQPLAELLLDQRLEQPAIERVLSPFNSEVGVALNLAQRSYSELIEVIDASNVPDKEHWVKELKRLCGVILFTVGDEPVLLNEETFVEWTNNFGPANAEFQKLLVMISSCALESERDTLSSR